MRGEEPRARAYPPVRRRARRAGRPPRLRARLEAVVAAARLGSARRGGRRRRHAKGHHRGQDGRAASRPRRRRPSWQTEAGGGRRSRRRSVGRRRLRRPRRRRVLLCDPLWPTGHRQDDRRRRHCGSARVGPRHGGHVHLPLCRPLQRRRAHLRGLRAAAAAARRRRPLRRGRGVRAGPHQPGSRDGVAHAHHGDAHQASRLARRAARRLLHRHKPARLARRCRHAPWPLRPTALRRHSQPPLEDVPAPSAAGRRCGGRRSGRRGGGRGGWQAVRLRPRQCAVQANQGDGPPVPRHRRGGDVVLCRRRGDEE
mmetsp:Transcript_10985/g.32554  ORF Transcript_10985/g.32554 Transcript_10985/m.32554 type:complete len:312 (+) Transcript_10985:342-1277(+)